MLARALWLVLPAAIALAGCAHVPAATERPGDVTDFAALYSQNCAACHGADGQNGPAIDLANPEYQALVDDATLRKWISGGMPGTQMPAFAQSAGGMLTDAQVNALVTGMRERWFAHAAFGAATVPPYAQSHPGDRDRGQQLFEAHCAGCHKSSREQIDSPLYLALVGDQALRSMILAGRPDIGQPDFMHDNPVGSAASPLAAQDVDDIVTYLSELRRSAAAQTSASVSQVPAGKEQR
jgi:mono/diheme cytochrome c family protein